MDEKTKELVEKRAGIGTNGCCIPANMRSPEERKRIGRLGGIKAQEINAKKRSAKEVMQLYLDCKITRDQAREKLGDYADFLPDEATLFDMISVRQIMEAGEGNAKSFEVVRDTAGYKPVDQVQADVNVLSDQDRSLLDKIAKRTGVDPGEG